MELCLVKHLLWEELEGVYDLVVYLLQYYIPLRNSEHEHKLIDVTEILIKNNFRDRDVFMDKLLNHKFMRFHPQIPSTCLERIIALMKKHRYQEKRLGIGRKAALYCIANGGDVFSLMDYFILPEDIIELYIDDFTKRVHQMPVWFPYGSPQEGACEQVVQFYLDRCLEEPLLEWMFIFPVKGLRDMVKEFSSSSSEKHKLFYHYLCIKRDSDGMRKTRAYFILHRTYLKRQ